MRRFMQQRLRLRSIRKSSRATTYYRNWHHWSLNEGYIYLKKFPWINVCVTLIDRFFYFSIAFKTHSWRFSVKGKA